MLYNVFAGCIDNRRLSWPWSLCAITVSKITSSCSESTSPGRCDQPGFSVLHSIFFLPESSSGNYPYASRNTCHWGWNSNRGFSFIRHYLTRQTIGFLAHQQSPKSMLMAMRSAPTWGGKCGSHCEATHCVTPRCSRPPATGQIKGSSTAG